MILVWETVTKKLNNEEVDYKFDMDDTAKKIQRRRGML